MTYNTCPKCPTGRMSTPTYCMGGGACLAFGCSGEHLLSRCTSCGYTKSSPCADSRSVMGGPEAIVDAIRQAEARRG